MKAADILRRLNRFHDLLLLIGFILLMLISNYCVLDSYYVYTHTVNEDILRFKPTAEGYDPDKSPISKDMVAWLTLDDTSIDQPVMQSEEPGKYLNTDPFGNYSLSGSLFLDSENSPDFSDDYSIIYGHHMQYGKMFGALDDFLDEDYLKTHHTGELIIGRNAERIYGLEVFAAAKLSAKEKMIFSVSETSDTDEFIYKNADICIGEARGRIVALSTCAESSSDMRIVVFCYIVE